MDTTFRVTSTYYTIGLQVKAPCISKYLYNLLLITMIKGMQKVTFTFIFMFIYFILTYK